MRVGALTCDVQRQRLLHRESISQENVEIHYLPVIQPQLVLQCPGWGGRCVNIHHCLPLLLTQLLLLLSCCADTSCCSCCRVQLIELLLLSACADTPCSSCCSVRLIELLLLSACADTTPSSTPCTCRSCKAARRPQHTRRAICMVPKRLRSAAAALLSSPSSRIACGLLRCCCCVCGSLQRVFLTAQLPHGYVLTGHEEGVAGGLLQDGQAVRCRCAGLARKVLHSMAQISTASTRALIFMCATGACQLATRQPLSTLI